MLLVYEMKNTLSIGEIKRVLQNVYALPEYDAQLPERIYTRYLEIKENERRELADAVHGFLDRNELSPDTNEDLFTLILGLSSLSSYLKNVVQILLDEYYPDLNAEKTREEAEKKEEAKQKKAAEKAEKKAAEEKKKDEKKKEDKKKKNAADTVESEREV